MIMMRRRRQNKDVGSSDEANEDSATKTSKDRDEKNPLLKPSIADSSSSNNRGVLDEDATTLPSSYFVAKFLILRLLGVVYFVALMGAWFQNRGLMGKHGLQPASDYMDQLYRQIPQAWNGFLQHPTIFWWLPVTDMNMEIVCAVGMMLSFVIVFFQVDSWLCMAILWLLDFSIVTIAGGTSFYSYGWESQLLETGFLACFLCQSFQVVIRKKDATTGFTVSTYCLRNLWRDDFREDPSKLVIWLFRWLSFRISLGAGLIKIRGSSCWERKTCLWYHFETQPIPSPLSFIFHFLPKSVLTRAVDLDLFVQLYTSWFVLVPADLLPTSTMYYSIAQWIVRIGGFLQAGFMLNIIMSGNFAFLNHLTVIPALACLDDACWPRFLQRIAIPSENSKRTEPGTLVWTWPNQLFRDGLLFILILYLSSPVITNLLQLGGSRQVMNRSFDNFRLVNTYGAFGDVGTKRFEPIVSVSSDNGTTWDEIEFPCKPGTVTRRPCFCAPYHYRLDWNIWFIGFPPHESYLKRRESWLYTLLSKILEPNAVERPWLALLDGKSAKMLADNRIQLAKADMYRYEMAAPLWSIVRDRLVGKTELTWWRRHYKEPLIPPVKLNRNGRLSVYQP